MHNGDFKDSQHEGHPGYVISAIRKKLQCSISTKPNLVLLNAGTNDCVFNKDIPNAHVRMQGILDDLFKNIDGVTVLLSTLLRNNNDTVNANVIEVNKQYRQLVKDNQAKGRKIELAEMNNGFIKEGDILSDNTHPTHDGYRKMAAVWACAFDVVEKKGWITPPNKIDEQKDANNMCDPDVSNFKKPVKTQKGGQKEYTDGEYKHANGGIDQS